MKLWRKAAPLARPGHVMAAAVLAVAGLLAGCGGDVIPAGLDYEPIGCDGRLGCASAHNLAVLAARPSDLVMPRREGPRDARRRETVLTAWRGDKEAAAQGASARQQGATP